MSRHNLPYYLCVIAWLMVVISILMLPAKSAEVEQDKLVVRNQTIVFGDVNKPAQEPVTYEDWFRDNANVIQDCEITYYCTEKREHICGTGDGITSTGVPVTAGWTCAVDPSVIPYGSDVMVDYGDRVEFYKAQDCGAAIKGNHIDLAVESHSEAIEAGVLTANVYFMNVEREY